MASSQTLKLWTCQRVTKGRRCGHRNPSRVQLCGRCGKRKPPKRRPDHLRALELPYEQWVERFGDRCNICGAEAVTRNLHRDHDHATGEPRGILCFPCNAALADRRVSRMSAAEWHRAAADYLDRAQWEYAEAKPPREDS